MRSHATSEVYYHRSSHRRPAAAIQEASSDVASWWQKRPLLIEERVEEESGILSMISHAMPLLCYISDSKLLGESLSCMIETSMRRRMRRMMQQ